MRKVRNLFALLNLRRPPVNGWTWAGLELTVCQPACRAVGNLGADGRTAPQCPPSLREISGSLSWVACKAFVPRQFALLCVAPPPFGATLCVCRENDQIGESANLHVLLLSIRPSYPPRTWRLKMQSYILGTIFLCQSTRK